MSKLKQTVPSAEPVARIDLRDGDLRCMYWFVPLQRFDEGTLLYTAPQPDRVAELEAECERLRKDAERYRWLRANCMRAVTIAADNIAISDSAIDAALAAKGE